VCESRLILSIVARGRGKGGDAATATRRRRTRRDGLRAAGDETAARRDERVVVTIGARRTTKALAIRRSPPMSRCILAAAALASAAAPAVADTCHARSGAVPPVVVELYTSEGCSSCPPADRWLSSLKGRGDVLALAFHVDYWDYLGWGDRYASAEATARQRQLARRDGSASVYTPQVRAAGQDWRRWPQLPAAAAARAPVLQLQRDGDAVQAEVGALPGGPALLSGYWVVVEDDHESRVSAGENAGRTLRHDHVVRLYRSVTPWAAAQGQRSRLTVTRGEPGRPRRVAFVVVDAANERPLQAVALAC
jgi:hypothetical protein